MLYEVSVKTGVYRIHVISALCLSRDANNVDLFCNLNQVPGMQICPLLAKVVLSSPKSSGD